MRNHLTLTQNRRRQAERHRSICLWL